MSWHHAFLKAKDRNTSELNMDYMRVCVERFNSGIHSDNTWVAKLMQMAYEAGYEAGKVAGEEDATNQIMQIQMLAVVPPGGNA